MKLVLITPDREFHREHALVREMFSSGLERLHVRKPGWTRDALAAWLCDVPPQDRGHLILHSHHELAEEFGCGGIHFRDVPTDESDDPCLETRQSRVGTATRLLTSRSCHGLDTLVRSVGRYDSVFFSPVFPSISKPGHAPSVSLRELSEQLRSRGTADRKTAVIALGGITATNAPRCLALGFDAVAVFGAVWQSSDPVKALQEIMKELEEHDC